MASNQIEYVQGACTICSNKETQAVNAKYKELDSLTHFEKLDNSLWKEYIREYNEAYDKEKQILATQKDWCVRFHGREKTEVQVCRNCIQKVAEILNAFQS